MHLISGRQTLLQSSYTKEFALFSTGRCLDHIKRWNNDEHKSVTSNDKAGTQKTSFCFSKSSVPVLLVLMHFQVLALFHDVDDNNNWAAAPSIHLLLCEYFNLLRHDIYFAVYRATVVFLELKRVSNFSLEKKKRKISYLWKKPFSWRIRWNKNSFVGTFPSDYRNHNYNRFK